MRIFHLIVRSLAALVGRISRGSVRETLGAFPRTSAERRPTHAEWAVSVFAASGLPADVRRARWSLRWGVGRLIRAVQQAAERHLALGDHLGDDVVAAVTAEAGAVRTRHGAGARWVTDGRVPRLLLAVVQPGILIADWTFFSSLLIDTWSVSLQRVTLSELPRLVAALALPLVLPSFVLACAAYAGNRLGIRRARRIDRGRVDAMLGAAAAEAARLPGITIALLVGASVYFFAVGVGRFQTDLDEAGSVLPAWVLALLFGGLPLIALVLETLSSQPLLQHDRAILRDASRFDRRERGLRRRVLGSQTEVLRSWMRLAQRVARIAASGNLSVQALEQELSLDWARTGAFGGLAPVVGSTPSRPAFTATHQPVVPDLTPMRGLDLEIAPRVLDELRPVLQVLAALRPDRWDSPRGMAEWIAGLGSDGAVVTRIDGSEPEEDVA